LETRTKSAGERLRRPILLHRHEGEGLPSRRGRRLHRA
jgi:hypothetical protein